MKHNQQLKFSEALCKHSPYEYKLRRYRVRKVRKEEGPRETEGLESFTTYGSTKRHEDSKDLTIQNVVLRRHLKKKEIAYRVRKSGLEAEPQEDVGAYVLEVKPVKEKDTGISYTFDMVNWEEAIDSSPKKEEIESKLLLDQNLDILQWEEGIIYDDRKFMPTKLDLHLVLDASDKNLLFDITEKDAVKEKKTKKRKTQGLKPIAGKYNISGDKHYVESNEALKSALGVQGMQHSIPALKLAPELYKTHLTKEELRFFHRPTLSLSPLSEIHFVPLLENDQKPSAVLKKKKNLTLRDTADLLLLEYSEEIPPLISNPGMASMVTTFCRKNSAKDFITCEPEAGGVTVLEPKDPSPFMFIGDVGPGEHISAVVNNLYKAPIFFHGTKDLLAIRTKGEKPQYYLRPIPSLACVGQTLPMDEVFSPHSRRYNLFCKNRLKVAAYRIFYEKGNKERKMYIHQLDALFPHFSEGSKRKWLKEYTECLKKGKDNVWVLRTSASLLSEEDLRKIVTPEHVCQYESMLAEERRLKDAGIVFAEDGDVEGDEIKLAVWNCTKNFVQACAGRGFLEISGPGDPTGIGEGFSFLKAKKKEREVEEEGEKKSQNEQMQKYKEEIKKVWSLQLAALSSKVPPEKNKGPKEDVHVQKRTIPEAKMGRILSITRTVIRNDKKCQETEIVTDPRIIDTYMKARKRQKREETRTSLRCGSCGQIGHMKTNKSCMNYKSKNSEKRKEKKKNPLAMLSEIILSVIKELFSVPFSIPFHRPVSLKKFPNYLEFVPNPIDLTTIKSKVRSGDYKSYDDFLEDVRLMSKNCRTYNGDGHSLTKISEEMIEIAEAARKKNREAIELLEDQCLDRSSVPDPDQ